MGEKNPATAPKMLVEVSLRPEGASSAAGPLDLGLWAVGEPPRSEPGGDATDRWMNFLRLASETVGTATGATGGATGATGATPERAAGAGTVDSTVDEAISMSDPVGCGERGIGATSSVAVLDGDKVDGVKVVASDATNLGLSDIFLERM